MWWSRQVQCPFESIWTIGSVIPRHQDHDQVRASEAAADTVASEVPDDNFQPTVATSEPDAPLPNTSS